MSRLRFPLHMVFLDFHNTQSGHKFTAELYKYGLLLKLLTIFGFRNPCKMQILYGIVVQS